MSKGKPWSVKLVDEIQVVHAVTPEEALLKAIRYIPSGEPITMPSHDSPWQVSCYGQVFWVIDDPVFATKLLVEDNQLAIVSLVRR